MRPKVLVSHPAKQHVHQLVYALQEAGCLQRFITSIWYKTSFPYTLTNLFPSKLKKITERELKKRYCEDLEKDFVEQFPFFEIVREGVDRLLKGYKNELGVYLENRIHDFYVAGRIGRLKPDIIVGYETSSLRTFRAAADYKCIKVLDLAQVHYKFLLEVRQKYTEYDRTFDNKVSDKVNRVKEEELKYADYILALSGLVKESLIKHNIPEDKIYLANLGFAPEKFRLKSAYRRDGIFRILYAGAVIGRKGVGILLEAYRQLSLENSELILIGGTAGDSDLLLRRYKGMYKYVSYLSHDELASYYQDADIFVFPSYLDSWGLVVIEAMGCGTPVIVSENTGAKETVSDGVNGFVIPVEDIAALKQKILFFYNNRDKLESFGKNARKRAENYTWENYRKRIREVISEIWERNLEAGRQNSDRIYSPNPNF